MEPQPDPAAAAELEAFEQSTYQLELAMRGDFQVEELAQLQESVEAARKSTLAVPCILHLLKTVLPKVISGLLKRTDLDEGQVEGVQGFLQSCLLLVIGLTDIDMQDAWKEIYGRIFNESYAFYEKYGPVDADMIPDEDTPQQRAVAREKRRQTGEQYARLPHNVVWDPSTLHIANLNFFGKQDGFRKMIERVAKQDPKISMNVLKLMLKPIAKAKDCWTPEFLEYFAPAIFTGVRNLCMSYTDEELKNEDKTHIADVFKQLESLMLQASPTGTCQQMEILMLEFGLKCLKTIQLEKRLAGISDIREQVLAVTRKNEYARRQQGGNVNEQVPAQYSYAHVWMESPYLIEWLRTNQIVEYLYGPSAQMEIQRRAVDILRFLATEQALTTNDLDLVWEAGVGKHEALEVIIFTSLWELASSLSQVHLDYLFQRISQLPLSSYAMHTVMLVRYVTMYGINNNAGAAAPKWYGLTTFWNLMQDEANVSDDINASAMNNLVELLQWPPCHGRRQDFIGMCVKNIEQHKSVVYSLRLLQKIVATYPPRGVGNVPTSVSCWVHIEQNLHLLKHFFDDLVYYKAAAKKAAAANTTPGVDFDKEVLVGKQTHTVNINERLAALMTFMSGSTQQVTLSVQQMDILWKCCSLDHITQAERDQYHVWMEQTCASPDTFSDEVVYHVYDRIIPAVDVASISHQGYMLFEYFFRFVNWKEKRFEQANANVITVQSAELKGMPLLWRFCFEANLDVVAKRASNFLIKLYQSLGPAVRHLAGEKRDEYVRLCMQAMTEGAKQITPESTEGDTRGLKVERGHMLLKMLLEEFVSKKGTQRHGAAARGPPLNIQVLVLPKNNNKYRLELHANELLSELRNKVAQLYNPKENPSQVRLITAGRELKDDNKTLAQNNLRDDQLIHATLRPKIQNADTVMGEAGEATGDEEDTSSYPARILSRQEYFDNLFSMLYLPRFYAEKVWELIMHLPTNTKMLQDMNDTMARATGDADWSHLLDANSTFKLYYCLQIVESQTYSANQDDPDRAKWGQLFQQRGGVKHLLSVFMQHGFQDVSKGGRRKACLSLLIRLINNFVLNVSPYNASIGLVQADTLIKAAIPGSVNTAELVVKLMNVIWFAATPQEKGGEGQDEANEEDVSVVKDASLLFIALLTSARANLAVLYKQPLQQWLESVLLKCAVPGVRAEAANGIQRLCAVSQDIDSADAKDAPAPLGFFLPMLLGFLDKLDGYTYTCQQFFELLNELVRISCAGGTPEELVPVLNRLVVQIRERPVVEERNKTNEDRHLIGILNLIATLVGPSKHLKQLVGPSSGNVGLVNEIFHRCLFDIPTVTNHGPLAPPKCKTQASRIAAFNLLTALARGCQDNYEELTALMLGQHTPGNGERKTSWHYLPSMYEKSAAGYVGLENLGATCYMNSLMQQFYMIPALRYGLLRVADRTPEEEKQDSFLYQLQTLFSYEQESEKKYLDTRTFCHSYKDYDGNPMNTHIQMDVDEFFNMLLDRLEGLIKGSGEETLLRDLFGGVTSNQIICQEKGHVSEREDSCYTISLEMKDKKNIQEALDLYVQGDLLEGDNKYSCTTCEQKVDALKRCCIKALPNTLIMHLKRFEFDYELLKRMKVNERFEFPMKLDMSPWTIEGLARKEAVNRAEAKKEVLSDEAVKALDAMFKPATYYEYELVGVLVHTGTADSGHYYSFIKEREPLNAGDERRWYRFNDTQVDFFNENDIPSACFGGLETVSQWDNTLRKTVQRVQPKSYNGYMLFYQRLQPYTATVPRRKVDDAEPPPTPAPTPVEPAKFPPTRDERAKLIPSDMFNSCWKENQEFLRDKNIFDVDYFNFIADVVHLDADAAGVLEPAPPQQGFDSLLQTIQLSTCFVVETLLHAKEKQSLSDWVEFLKGLYSKHLPACRWFLTRMVEDPAWPRAILLQCTVAEARKMMAELISHVVATLAPHERPIYTEEDPIPEQEMPTEYPNSLLSKPLGRPRALVIRFMDSLLSFVREAPEFWRNFSHFFMVLADFAALSRAEKEYFLNRSALAELINFYLEDEAPYPPDIEPGTTFKRMGDKFRPAQLEYLMTLIATLVKAVVPGSEDTQNHALPEGTPVDPLLECTKMDLELIYNQSFYMKAMKQGINTAAVGEIMCHLCWESETTSRHLINLVIHGFNSAANEEFKNYFEVMAPFLSIPDSLREGRCHVAMQQLIASIDQKKAQKAEMFVAMKSMVKLVETSAAARLWLHDNMHLWLKKWVIENPSELVREEAEALCVALIPQMHEQQKADAAKKPATAVATTRTTPATSAFEPELYTEETKQQLRDLYIFLLSMITPSLVDYVRQESDVPMKDGEEVGHTMQYSKLVSYFKLLKMCILSHEDKCLFTPYHAVFWHAFQEMDACHFECDENKQEMVNFWLIVLTECPANLTCVTNDEKSAARMMDFFVSLRPNERYLQYNKEALPAWYRIVGLLCAHDGGYCDKIMNHRNFDWAVKNLYRESAYYVPVAEVLYPALVICCRRSAEFRAKHIPLVLQSDKLSSNHRNLLRFLEALLITVDDCVLFASHDGLSQLSVFIELRRDTDAEDRQITVVEQALELLHRALMWMVEEQAEPLKRKIDEIREQWETKVSLLSTLMNFLSIFTGADARARLYAIIKTLTKLDNGCLEEVLNCLFNEHECLARDRQTHGEGEGTGRVKYMLGGLSDEQLAAATVEVATLLPAYYQFVRDICRDSVSRFQRNARLMSSSLHLTITVALETMTMTELHGDFIRPLLAVWLLHSNLSGLVKEERLIDQYLGRVLQSDVHLLDRDRVTDFLIQAFDTVFKRMDPETAEALINVTLQRMSTVAQGVMAGLPAAPEEQLERMSELVVNVKAVRVLFGSAEVRENVLAATNNLAQLRDVLGATRQGALLSAPRATDLQASINAILPPQTQ